MTSVLQQIKNRRLALSLKQSDMLLRAGISRQQYQHIESKGNPRLETLELVASGLNSEVMLIPNEKLEAVRAILNGTGYEYTEKNDEHNSVGDDPWQGLLEDVSDE